MATTTSPASIVGPSAPTSFFSTLASFNPLKGLGTSIGAGISSALGISPTVSDFQKANPTIPVAANTGQYLDATMTNAANFLGINLKTATSAQLTQVRAKAAEFINAGKGNPTLALSTVDKASALSTLTGAPVAPSSEAPATPNKLVSFIGQAVGALAPTLVQTGVSQYLAKNDPTLRAQRQAQEEYLKLQGVSLSNQLTMSQQMADLERAKLAADTEVRKAEIDATLKTAQAAYAASIASVVPATNVPTNQVYPLMDGTLGYPAAGGGQSSLATLLSALAYSGAQPVMAPQANGILTNDLSVLQAQQKDAAAAAASASSSNLGRNLAISAVVIGGIIFLATRKKGNTRRAA